MDDKKRWSNYNPVMVTSNDTIGTLLLGILALILLIALLRAQARNRRLLAKLARIRRS